jgi:hypothetical protein
MSILIVLALYATVDRLASSEKASYYVRDPRLGIGFTNFSRTFKLIKSPTERKLLGCSPACNADGQCVGFSQLYDSERRTLLCNTASSGAQVQPASHSRIHWKRICT